MASYENNLYCGKDLFKPIPGLLDGEHYVSGIPDPLPLVPRERRGFGPFDDEWLGLERIVEER